MAFNFGQIGGIVAKYMDTDTMDIYRQKTVIQPDASTIDVMPDEPLYLSVPCHISYSNTDNPKPENSDIQPIIVSAVINCAVNVDIQKGDYVFARKLANDLELATYKGVVGLPEVYQSRKTVVLAVR